MVNGTLCRTPSSSSRRTTPNFSSPRGGSTLHRKHPIWSHAGYISAISVSLLVASFIFVTCSLLYLCFYRNLIHTNSLFNFESDSDRQNNPIVSAANVSTADCDIFDGSWIFSNAHPLYNSSLCPFAERGFNCLENGRKDTDYMRWRWKPHGCDIPRFNATAVLEKLRGKRVVFVGDSMSRTQWESMICMLMIGVQDPRSVYEVNGNGISKTIRFLSVRFQTFNLTVEFFRSVYLLQQGVSTPSRRGPKRVRSTIKLDQLDDVSKSWVDSDVLIFNSGHWWTPKKLFYTGCYFQVGESLKLGLPITTAFRTMLQTWASWVKSSVNTSRTQVFFRTFEPSHWSEEGGGGKVCDVTEQPMKDPKGNDQSEEFSGIISDVIKSMMVPATVLNVTSMGAYRSDAHIGNWSYSPLVVDCSHWCLPGVPDAWNELVFSHLAAQN